MTNQVDVSHYAVQVLHALERQQYDLALELYSRWFDSEPDWFRLGDLTNRSLKTHLMNAGSLARKALFDKVQHLGHISPRIEQAISMFFGLRPKHFQQPLQQPSFFYIPDLTAKPFFSESDITGLSLFIQQLMPFTADLHQLAQLSYEQYVDTSGPVPNSSDWQAVKERWLSTHLLRGGEAFTFADPKIQALIKLLTHEVIADCPPHAAEAFVSSLLPGAQIPPHYGISNLKLTVHIPLQVNALSSLKVGEQQFCWEPETKVLIFDDSFLHSAQNLSTERRDVFIFDVWHPDLTQIERQVIRDFMTQHRLWSAQYAKLAGLDGRI